MPNQIRRWHSISASVAPCERHGLATAASALRYVVGLVARRNRGRRGLQLSSDREPCRLPPKTMSTCRLFPAIRSRIQSAWPRIRRRDHPIGKCASSSTGQVIRVQAHGGMHVCRPGAREGVCHDRGFRRRHSTWSTNRLGSAS